MSQFNGAPEKAKRLRLLKSAREHIMCSMSVLYLHVYMYRGVHVHVQSVCVCTSRDSMSVLYLHVYMYIYMYNPCACARVGTVEVSMADCCTRHGSADHAITLEG